MRILITGSEGVLGRPLVAELRRRGHSVWGVSDQHSADAQTARADVAIRHQLERAFQATAPEFVYHLAAEFGRLNGEAYSEQLWTTAMIGTRNVLECCLEHGSRLAFASSSEVYGNVEAAKLEEDLTDQVPIPLPNEYALSKWANEQQIEAFRRRNPGLDAVRLRFFNAYGPGEAYHPFRSVIALFCHRALHGEPLPVYQGYFRTFMFIDDFIPTLANVCEARRRGWPVYNIGGNDYRSVEIAAQIVADEVPGTSLELIPEDVHNTRSKLPDISRAAKDFGHHPKIPLEQGIPSTLEWMRGCLRETEIPPS